LSSRFAIHALAIEQSARPGGPNAEADLCAIKTNIQNPLDNFILKRGSRATGKPEFYFVQRKHFGFIQTLVCKSTPMSKQLEFVCRHVLGANQIVFTVITSSLN
jgi:hypothetical protein